MMLRRLVPDLQPLRASRQLRLLVVGGMATSLGTQATLVALPYQVYTQTRSASLTGLLGAAELGPLVLAALVGGAWADRGDRRRVLLGIQTLLIALTAALTALGFVGSTPVAVLFVLAGALAGAGAVQNVAESAIVPTLVSPELVPSALALDFGLRALTQVVGPALAGVVIAAAGLGVAYAIDAASCLVLVAAVLRMGPQPPTTHVASDVGIGRSILDGLRFVRRQPALLGSFAIDLNAMAFGMPRALFPVLAVTVYNAGAAGAGLLYAAVSAGATIGALTTGWLRHARYLGRIVIVAVIAWGLAIAATGLTTSLWLAVTLLAVAGAADSISAVCRSTINQTVTPDAMRGRMSSVFSLVVTSGPRIGDVESGSIAGLAGARASVGIGGISCTLLVGVVALAFPALAAYDAHDVRAATHTDVARTPNPSRLTA
jgi:MFS family permease